MSLKLGDRIWLSCEIREGMFPSERSIRVELDGPESKVISGFVPKEFVKGSAVRRSGQVAVFVAGRSRRGSVPILFPGEILTSTNPVEMPMTLLTGKGSLEKTVD